MTKLDGWIVWGAAGHAKVVRDAVGRGVPLVAAFDTSGDVGSPFDDVPLMHGRDAFVTWRAANTERYGFVVAIGGPHGPTRCELHDWLSGHGLVPMTVRHPTAFIADSARVGEGSHVLAQAAVCVDVSLGRQCIINTGAVVDHECVLGDGVHVAPGATLAGMVVVEAHAFIGTGATVLPRLRIGAGATIGAGAVVVSDVPAGGVVVGVPARQVIRKS